MLQGLAFGLLFLNTAAAIVTYFVLPTAFSIVANLWPALHDAAPWVDLGTSQQPLFSATQMGSDQWLHLASGTAIWVVLPFVLGLIRCSGPRSSSEHPTGRGVTSSPRHGVSA